MIPIQNTFFPKWISNKAIMVYVAALLLVTGIYFRYSMPWYYMLSGAVSVFCFFFFGNKLSRTWGIDKVRSEKRFEKKIFWTSFALRLGWVLLIYTIFQNYWGNAFGFENMDATFYDSVGRDFANGWRKGDLIGAVF